MPLRNIGITNADRLSVKRYPTAQALAQAAAQDVADRMTQLLRTQPEIRVVFAAAPSQDIFYTQLIAAAKADFARVTAFHMDEYIGLAPQAPQGFGNYLRQRLFQPAAFGRVHYINASAETPEEECFRYAQLLGQAPIDIVCMGIGENGHIAFNDPPVADFSDPCCVKVVRLDAACRNQQVHDGCFSSLDAVPTHAYTLTIPALTEVGAIFCVVPGKSKAAAVQNALRQPVSEACPASVLRRCGNAVLYLDSDSGALL